MWGDLLLSLLFTLLSIVMFVEARALPEGLFGTLGPGYFPGMILGCLIALSGALTVRLLFRALAAKKAAPSGETRSGRDDGEGAPSFYKKYRFVGMTFVAFFLYLLGMKWVGFLPATLVFMVGTMWMLSPADRNWGTIKVIAFTSVLLTFGLYSLFTYGFSVMLPAGVLF